MRDCSTSNEIHEGDEAPTSRRSRSSTSRSSPTGRGSCAGRPRTPTPPSSVTRSARPPAPGTSTSRPDDLLWTGTAYREFALWRERYPGGLHRPRRGIRRRHDIARKKTEARRRIATTAAVVLALVIAAVFGSLWRRSVLETRRAEASKLPRPRAGPARNRPYRGTGLRDLEPRTGGHI